MLTLLLNGDIIIDVKAEEAIHSFVYRHEEKQGESPENISKAHRIYHSTIGSGGAAVRSNTIRAEWGGALVFRFNDPALRDLLATAVASWVPANPEDEKDIPRATQKTPFAEVSERTPDDSLLNIPSTSRSDIAFFRAVRAYERNVSLQPLSKNKGVSCSQFVGFALKAALLKYLFPEGLPENIKTAMASLQEEKRQFSAEQKKLYGTKMDVDETYFDAVEMISDNKKDWNLKHLSQFSAIRNRVKVNLLQRQNWNDLVVIMNFLSEPIKGKDINNLLAILNQYSSIFECAGRLCYAHENKILKPYLLADVSPLLVIRHQDAIPTDGDSKWWVCQSDEVAQLKSGSWSELPDQSMINLKNPK